MISRIALFCLLASAPAFAATFAGVDLPAPPPPRSVVDTHWGVAVDDPYRFLEDTADPDVQKLMKGQSDAAHAILAKLPGRERLLARIKEIDADTPAVVSNVQRDERGGLYYLKREASDNQFKLYRREGAAGAESLVVDPDVETRASGKPHAIGAYTPSPDGRLVAYQVSAGGSEIGTLRVIEADSGKEVTPRIDRIRGGGASWLPDGSGLFYDRLAEDYEKRPRAERFMDTLTWFRKLSEPAKDNAVFGAGLDPAVAIERTASGFVAVVPGHALAAAWVFHGVDPNRSLYLADLEGVIAGKPRWRKVFDQAALVNDGAAAGGFLYLKTAKDAPRYQVLRVALPEADPAKAQVVFAPAEEVVSDIAAAKDALYVTRRDGAAKHLWRVAHAAGAKPERVSMPFEGNIGLSHVDPILDGAILALAGWTRATKHYSLGARDAAPALLVLAPPGKYDAPAGIVAREVKVKSHDGVEVPVSIIARAGIKLDGANPAMLYGYGAYGIVDDPGLTPRSLAWLEQGGVLAVAHVRGGGIYGDGWRRAGWKTTKPNTWKDGIAAAEWLVANGYTSANKLAIYGGSAGGIFVGRAITERPDLFAAAVIGVGNTDSVRSETRANGAGNIPEYGTVKREDEFRALLAMSPYANVKPSTAYPAVLFEHGVNDTRVDVWMTLKTGSRLAAASNSGKPVLMRLEYEGGHGPGTTRDQAQMRTADRWSFFLWQSGSPDFQPAR